MKLDSNMITFIHLSYSIRISRYYLIHRKREATAHRHNAAAPYTLFIVVFVCMYNGCTIGTEIRYTQMRTRCTLHKRPNTQTHTHIY